MLMALALGNRRKKEFMRLLNWNRQKVQNLSDWEIWGFIAARVFVGFGLGSIIMQYFPQIGVVLGIPTLIIGIGLLLIAGKGFFRKESAK